MSFHLIFLIILTFINFFLGALVWQKEKKNIVNRAFLMLIFFAILWILTLYISDLPSKASILLFWNKLTLVYGLLFAFSFVYFCLIFANRKERVFLISNSLLLLFILLLLFFLISVTLFTDLVVAKVEIFEWGINIISGKLYFLVGSFYFLVTLIGFSALFLKYKKSKGIERLQIQYLFVGLLLSAIGILTTNLIHPAITGKNIYAKYGPYFITFFIFFTTLAITRYHLFGIEVILTEILVVAIGVLLLFQVFGAPTIFWRMVNSIIFVLFFIGGWLLIKYIFREIKRREEAERLSQAKTEFLSIVSHQLRTPLTAIKGYLSMILEGTYGKVSATTQKPIENIYASNERLIRLVNDFLQVSRLETGKIDVEFKKTNLESLIQGIVDELWIKAKAKNLYLKFEKPKEQVPEILADKEKIRQVILNLIDNAIRYTSAGGVNISLEKTKNYVRIIVKDSGEGLEKEEAERLFKSFSRGAAGHKMWTEGAGLGLYIAKKLVDLHKGKIWATSEGKQKGSTFYVELPIL